MSIVFEDVSVFVGRDDPIRRSQKNMAAVLQSELGEPGVGFRWDAAFFFCSRATDFFAASLARAALLAAVRLSADHGVYR